MSRLTYRLLVLGFTSITMLEAADVAAVPITYTFTTGGTVTASDFDPTGATPTGPNAALAAFFAPLTVTGSFVYDSESPVTSTATNPTLGTQFLYDGAITLLSGNVGSFAFADASGRIQFANDTLLLPTPTGPEARDLLQLSGFGPDFTGFDLGNFGLTLQNARLSWFEGNPTGSQGEVIPDFLTDATLPVALPTLLGSFGFTFGALDGSTRSATVSWRELAVAPVSVPEPGTLSLLGAGIGLLALRRRGRGNR